MHVLRAHQNEITMMRAMIKPELSKQKDNVPLKILILGNLGQLISQIAETNHSCLSINCVIYLFLK